MRTTRIVLVAVQLICLLINPARPQSTGHGALVFSTIVQPQGWHVNDFAINNHKSVLYGGGGGNQVDGLVLVTDSQYRKFLSFDDPAPGVPGNFFWGVRSFSLNDRDEAAFDGSSVLRLQVVPGAGSAFVLSDPFRVSPDQHYRLSGQLRHYLKGSEGAYFSVLEFDSSGNLSSFNETSAHAGESTWDWQLESVHIRTAPNTAYIRIRFGLIAQDSYLDVDDVRIAALP